MFAHLPRAFLFSRTYPEAWIRFFLEDREEWERFLRSIRLPRLATAALAPVNYLRRNRGDWLYRAGLYQTTPAPRCSTWSAPSSRWHCLPP